MTPENYLRTKQFKLRKAPGEWQTQCPFCGDTNKYGHLYVNREHGAYMCHRCGEQGSFYALQKAMGDEPLPAHRELADKWRVWEVAVEMFQDALVETPDALDYLRNERGLKATTIGKYRLGYAPKDTIDRMIDRGFSIADLSQAGMMSDKHPLFWNRIMIPYYQRGRVVTLRGKQIGGNVIQAKDTSIHLYGADNVRGRTEVFICEGEFDAMYLDQLGYSACAIPGALSYQEHWNWWFEDARRVFLVLDADEAGLKGAHKIEATLGNKTRRVDFPVPRGVKSTDVTEFFRRDGYTTGDFDSLVDTVRGQRLFTMKEALQERDELRLKQGLGTGWKELDRAIHPGLLPGQVATVLAKTGAGKTALLSQLCHNLSSYQTYDGEETGPSLPVLVLSLEQTKAEFGERLSRIGRLWNPWANEEELTRWYSKLLMCDENRIPAGDVRLLLDEYVEAIGMPPRLMIVDYLGYWSRAFKAKSKYEQVSEAVMELKRIAKEYQIAIVAPHQVSRAGRRGQRLELDFARDSGVVEETSDFVFSLFRPNEDREEQSEEEATWEEKAAVKLEILKSRHGSVGRMLTLMWAPYSLALLERNAGHGLERRVEREWKCTDLEMLYEDVAQVHRGTKHVR